MALHPIYSSSPVRHSRPRIYSQHWHPSHYSQPTYHSQLIRYSQPWRPSHSCQPSQRNLSRKPSRPRIPFHSSRLIAVGRINPLTVRDRGRVALPRPYPLISRCRLVGTVAPFRLACLVAHDVLPGLGQLSSLGVIVSLRSLARISPTGQAPPRK